MQRIGIEISRAGRKNGKKKELTYFLTGSVDFFFDMS